MNKEKCVSIIGLAGIGLIAGTVPAWIISGLGMVCILSMKDKTPQEKLVEEIQKSFKYSYEDAEEYAKKLKDMALEEYRKEFKNA
ncbi:hypothetical protein FDB84_09695 [Clostridium sporogenes]|nr:hypothetical protein [Clostridium sporogenes]